ncbi:UDP-glucose 4-epimerase [Vibrio nigripulchritudo SFn27]|uniref:UDP-glucose 4-epimerase n=1 Tax=Vibrio nigripulchritudo TaxID=28173 RepID=U4KA83_9VIBR|nr:SDR family oxidoreductase [Vibrio nigripulchritudo]CCN81688.1 UDP-glucose 4-epimerase [Vibrio nigripulchritudo BLFn1]CCN91529.1 UDP-glucose 4-epimerase [Vibrio nigripulchritudo SFn27]CCN95670.1 UDP-glucose 4-epimerase [Vibrio nigripulchritudo ENn2]CCO39491.1 UDP-glucose 4-epimerase [Vibrio nigripulchritudo SFn135]CCO51165.1 UDP-glucose 4-epimerase [Vibrio nigripulchritudo Wn13]
MKLLVTGGTGFVGSQVCQQALYEGWEVACQHRNHPPKQDKIELFKLEVGSATDWSESLRGVDCIVHCAARVHQMHDEYTNPLDAYREVNTKGTTNLALQAAQAGVKRLIFLSSVKVNGESTEVGKPFTSKVEGAPSDPYGLSKFEAEKELHVIAKKTGLEIVIIRPPLVYGPGVKANFLTLLKVVKLGLPLPLGSIKNTRSLVFIENLVDLILECAVNPDAKGHTFLASDEKSVSTPELLKCIAASMSKRYWVIPFPSAMLKLTASLVGKSDIVERLAGNLEVDPTQTFDVLSWKPPVSFEDGIKKTVNQFVLEQ